MFVLMGGKQRVVDAAIPLTVAPLLNNIAGRAPLRGVSSETWDAGGDSE